MFFVALVSYSSCIYITTNFMTRRQQINKNIAHSRAHSSSRTVRKPGSRASGRRRANVTRMNIATGSAGTMTFGTWEDGHRIIFPELKQFMDQMGLTIFDSVTVNRSKNTCDKYRQYYNKLWDFFKANKLYESMIILLENPPVNAPPIAPSHLIMFMKQMREQGSWLTKKNDLVFKSAISTLHNNRGFMNTQYTPSCPYCVKLLDQLKSQFIGCSTHLGDLKYCRATGNPTMSVEMKEYMVQVNSKTSGYVETQMESLDPFQYYEMLQVGYKSNTVFGLMVNVMIAIGVSCFCRVDELILLKHEHINIRMSHFRSDGVVTALCLQVKGKKDRNDIRYLYLYRNPKKQLLCPVNCILWWLSVSGIKSGYLFPPSYMIRKHIGVIHCYSQHVGKSSVAIVISILFAVIT